MSIPMALVTVIMVAVVTIILPSPKKKSGILNRPDRKIIMVMTVGIDAYLAFMSVFVTVIILLIVLH